MRLSVSAVVLNWNRADLLDRCIESFLNTAAAFDDCIVIDNNSTDASRSVIEKWVERDGRVSAMLKPENRGAEWINEAVARLSSDLVFIIANDKVMLPGWLDYVQRVFATFPEVAQLALHAPAPLDNEVWRTKPATYRFRDGVGLYEATGNTGMSSVLRRSVIVENGIVFGNLPSATEVRLPADGQLSTDIKEAGMLCAWSDRYYVLNAGHTIEEFKGSPEYYDKNYEAKPWLLRSGLAQRIADHEALPKPVRASRIFDWNGIPECEPADLGKPARAWSILDGGGPSLEFTDFAYGFVRLVKPGSVAVIRGWGGFLPVAVGRALRDNGVGACVYYEPDAALSASAAQRLQDAEVHAYCSPARDVMAPHADLAIISGYFRDRHADMLVQAARQHLQTASHLLIEAPQMSDENLAELNRLTNGAHWERVRLPAPRAVTLLSRWTA